MASTKNPTGLSTARNNNKFACTWKLGEKYEGGQQFKYRYNGADWSKAVDISKTATSKSQSLNFSKFYPTTNKKLKMFKFAVRGRNKDKSGNVGKWSAWTPKEFAINPPRKPGLTVTPSDNLDNRCTFAWSATASNTDAYPLINCEYQSMLIANSNTSDGSKLSWSSSKPGWRTAGVNGASGSINIDETAGSIATGTHTRWFRVRSRGPGGPSDWQYGRRVYATPQGAKITKTSWTKTPSNGTQVTLTWSNSANQAYPVQSVDAEYVVAVPGANLSLPAGVTWTKATTLTNTSNKTASIVVPTVLDVNQAIWVRVNTNYINKTNEGAEALVRTWYIENPSITSVTPDTSTYRATIVVNNPTPIPDAFTVVQYRTVKNPSKVATVGVIPHGDTSITVQCPNWTEEGGIEFGIYACVGSYKATPRADGVSSVAVTERMRSKGVIWQGGTVPQAPSEVTLSTTNIPNTIRVEWDWPWQEATGAVISWADHADAWESTDGPQTYEITNVNASAWNIAGITTGTRWYVRVRLTNGDVMGDWSDIAEIDLSSAPDTPALQLSAGIIPPGGVLSASWVYVTTDGTSQAYAEVAEFVEGQYSRPIAATKTAQSVNIYADEQGWDIGETHLLAVKVVSASGVEGEWSDLVPVTIAEPLNIDITYTSLVDETITIGSDTYDIKSLKSLPLVANITGAGDGGTTTLIVERAEDYHVARPDETDFNGYEGETIAVISQVGEEQITIDRDDLWGRLDDGARYRLIATIQDGIGQSASEIIDFEVHWSHQAVFPEGDAVIYENNVAIITPYKPEGWAEGDTCDIYRLSADLPELIIEGAEFDEVYVDPYPAIGEFAGHRIVYKTKDGDYITEDNEIAWLDITAEDGDTINANYSIIDFNGDQILARWNMDISSEWSKDFIETKYLGGSITGDWNKGVSQSNSLKAVALTTRDAETIKAVRRLANYEGICHIRTVDGASYACDIQVSESMSYSEGGRQFVYNLKITRVDPDSMDGVTYAEWIGS